MNDPARKRATRADLEAVPSHLVGEIVDGDLYASPRPAVRRARAVDAFEGDARVRAVPFDAIEIDLASLWRMK